MSRTIYGYQWSEHNPEVNFGDMITELILTGMGIKYKPVGEAPSGAPVCLMVGTVLDADRYHLMTNNDHELYVWGSGFRGDESLLRDKPIFWRAVRGPFTRDMLWLDHDITLGDPALQLPTFYDRSHNGKVICVPHWESIYRASANACELVSPLCRRDEVLDVVMKIASADFVLAGSLHAAIIAHAYGVPWAFWGSCSEGCRTKWTDFAGYLGLGMIQSCSTIQEGMVWYDKVGQYIRPESSSELLDVFPYDAVVN